MFRNKKTDTTAEGTTIVGDENASVGGHARTVPPETANDDHMPEDEHETLTGAEPMTRDQYATRKEQYGGLKGGAVLFGWLDAVALTILLVGILSAIATAVGSSLDVTQSEAELRAGSIGVASAIALVATLVAGYLAGGYVAGRLARFNGARQGVGVWLFGLIITIVVAVVGTVFGDKYNVFDRINLPSLPVRTDELTSAGIITAAAVLVGTLIAAIIGGAAGQRFHTKIDRKAL